jgi:heme/copper-type cytochrome/quinol oxidase subunit 2
MKKTLVFLVLVLLASSMTAVFADAGPRNSLPDPSVTKVGSLGDIQENYVDKILNWIFSLLVIFSVLFVLIAAWKYLMAAGDSKAAGEARKMIWYAMIAIAIALLAKGVPKIVGDFFNHNIETP